MRRYLPNWWAQLSCTTCGCGLAPTRSPQKRFFTDCRGRLGFGFGFGFEGCGLIHLMGWLGRPLPPLRRPPFFLEKGGKTAGSCIRPYAALRVPSAPATSRPARPTTCYASLHLAPSATPKGANAPGPPVTSARPPEVAKLRAAPGLALASLVTREEAFLREGGGGLAPRSDVTDTPQSRGKPAPTGGARQLPTEPFSLTGNRQQNNPSCCVVNRGNAALAGIPAQRRIQ